ncbi:hypothetical protein MKX67_00900 [Cytobacillus sp. FSL W7-1323]|uniref:hypothetical protein n=1 Tax=unclassified Cytobacillus TaxID=2675268 RepID=UPI002AFDDFA6|nr:hypothetical protein [Cytobacillus sp. OWB-43]MEA1855669.1 HEPN domain-containing protein [Cytobacillus sp. OWB-43]
MKYKFITILHRLKLENILNKGKELIPGTRISNGEKERNDILNSDLLRWTAGSHSVDEFNDTVYFYKYGVCKDIKTFDEMDNKGSNMTFTFLRDAQEFVNSLWRIKDNGVYVRDGFLIAYEKEIQDGRTYKASLTETFKRADGKQIDDIFTMKEIEEAIHTYTPFSLDEVDEESFGGKLPDTSLFYKSGDPGRLVKAFYFTLVARTSFALPMKIVFYCTALECLFSTSTTDLTHRISERVGIMIGTSQDEKIELYKFIKKVYGFRSTIIHGSSIKSNDQELISYSTKLDEILRQLISAEHEVFSKNNDEMDNFFLEHIFM